VKVTALVENTCAPNARGLRKELGLSMFVEHAGKRILFDTGASDAFADNAAKLGVDLAAVDLVVVSHHHYDHGGGLRHFLSANQRAPVVMAQRPHGECVFNLFGLRKSIGLDPRLFEEHADRFRFVDGRMDIWPGVTVLTQIGTTFDEPRGNRLILLSDGQTLRRDRFEHELVMVLQDDEGLAVFTGCSHHGILNMVHASVKAFPGCPLKAVFGGFHLTILPMLPFMDGSRAEVVAIARQLLTYAPAHVFTGHCTGAHAFKVIKGVMGTKLEYFATGACVEI
jgi:7,8-dihydropterin-6-yl-methyl-4-(beta-D-ribofuranosyl)aminobenzene 5'-phosphate synthase